MNRTVLGGAPLNSLHGPSMSVMLLCVIGLPVCNGVDTQVDAVRKP